MLGCFEVLQCLLEVCSVFGGVGDGQFLKGRLMLTAHKTFLLLFDDDPQRRPLAGRSVYSEVGVGDTEDIADGCG